MKPRHHDVIASQRVAVGYCRVSTEGQAVDGVSLDAQAAKLREWATLHDYRLVDVLVDAGLSGCRADNRPALQKALDLAAQHRAPIVVYKLDRLARSTGDAIDIIDRLHKAGADLVSLGERIDTTSAMGRMFFTLTCALAQLERDLTSERTVAALAHKRSLGERTGTVPYGYRLADDGVHLLPHPQEQAVATMVRKLRASGLSYRLIADKLADAGIPTRKGRPWHPQQVANIVNAAPRG